MYETETEKNKKEGVLICPSILPPVKKKNPGKPINKRLSGISRSFILYDRPLVDTICSGFHYNITAISIQVL